MLKRRYRSIIRSYYTFVQARQIPRDKGHLSTCLVHDMTVEINDHEQRL